MIKPLQKILFFDRFVLVFSLLAVATVIFTISVSVYTKGIERTNNTLRSHISELQGLQGELAAIKGVVESKEKKIGLTRTGGVVPTLEQTLGSLGMKAKVIKPLEKNKAKEYIEEDAEVEIQDTDLNAIVNLLYKIDNSPAPMKVKNAVIKTAFDNPKKFILKMTVSLISRG
jgi:hypothetical protein